MRLDFATILVVLVAVTGIIWLIDALFFAPARKRDGGRPEPKVVEYAKSFFPVFFVVFLVRSFIAEPFRIPSGSMMPTLVQGDFILVNKFSYGLRTPVLDTVFWPVGEPETGDVVVFRYPEDPSTPFIKRVIGTPGDLVEYRDKELYINGTLIEQEPAGTYRGRGAAVSSTGDSILTERLPEASHRILEKPYKRSRDGRFQVPEGHYFMLGDNRDDSHDSRYWPDPFVPDKYLIGKAFTIWFHWDFQSWPDLSRIGSGID